MASAFSICALVARWREYIPPAGTEDTGQVIDDPHWLVGINAAQLAIALISNLFLLLNMARRVRFSIAQPVTIIGWYISSFALIGLCACASGPLIIEPRSEHAFTQAFYYAIFSAILYFICATLMLATVLGAYAGQYEKEFQLTMSQRTLMLQTISFLCYLNLGALVYSHIEGWEYLDAVYWADFTLLTVGIGDFAPTTHLGRGLLFPFAIGGIIILGLVIGSIRSLVLERGKVKMGARMVEKERRRILKKIDKSDNSSLLEPITGGQNRGSMSRSSTLQELADTHHNQTLSERERRQKEFDLMRKIQEDAHQKRRWTSLIISATTWFTLWFIGAVVFKLSEVDQGWSYFESLYFSYTSLLTIGYGDIYPISNSGKPFFVFWSLMAIPSLTILISNMGDTIVKGIRDLTLWIGSITVLPGEKGLRAAMKTQAHQLTRGRLFDPDINEQPPGILGDSSNKPGNESENEGNGKGGPGQGGSKNDPESSGQRALGDRANHETKTASRQARNNDELPKSKRHYHTLLIKEMGKVMQHVHSNPPRKYTFDEWAWYLKLIGEDESSAETHRKAPRKPPKGEELGAGGAIEDDGEGKGEQKVKWSWIGTGSPLMGNKEEAEWVLHRLTRTLERELDAMRKEELEAEGKGEGARKQERRKESAEEDDEPEIQESPSDEKEHNTKS